jgi:hypothetical protein
MLPSEKNIKSLIKKIQNKCEKKAKAHKPKTPNQLEQEMVNTTETSEVFNEMKKPSFSE